MFRRPAGAGCGMEAREGFRVECAYEERGCFEVGLSCLWILEFGFGCSPDHLHQSRRAMHAASSGRAGKASKQASDRMGARPVVRTVGLQAVYESTPLWFLSDGENQASTVAVQRVRSHRQPTQPRDGVGSEGDEQRRVRHLHKSAYSVGAEQDCRPCSGSNALAQRSARERSGDKARAAVSASGEGDSASQEWALISALEGGDYLGSGWM